MRPIEKVLARFRDARPSSKEFSACCPSHEDRSPSLSIDEGCGGRALIHCHAECSPEAVRPRTHRRAKDVGPFWGVRGNKKTRPRNAPVDGLVGWRYVAPVKTTRALTIPTAELSRYSPQRQRNFPQSCFDDFTVFRLSNYGDFSTKLGAACEFGQVDTDVLVDVERLADSRGLVAVMFGEFLKRRNEEHDHATH